MAKRNDWRPDETRVLVVAGGRGAREQAKRFGLYHCQNRRSFKASRWIAFYARGAIDTLARIEGVPEDDVIIADRPELADLAAEMPRTNGDPTAPHSLFILSEVQEIDPIKNDKIDCNGRRIAWVQGQRYTTIDQLRAAKVTSQLDVH